MLCLTCTTISSVDLASYGVSPAKNWVSVDCGIVCHIVFLFIRPSKTGRIMSCPPSVCLLTFCYRSITLMPFKIFS